MATPRPFSAAQLETLCQTLADTNEGLTGSEIERLLRDGGVDDVDPTNTKWKRLYNALVHRQNREGSARCVLSFIKAALDPARYLGRGAMFEARRTSVNGVLALYGLEFRTDSKFYVVDRAQSLSEAEDRAHRLRGAMSARGVHPDVLASCRAELVQNNAFHAVLEASKSVGAKLRQRASLTSDGAALVDESLSGDAPRLRINKFRDDSDKSEQKGFANLVKGLFGAFRNPTAHAPRVEWVMSEEDALDLFSLASYIHRRLDAAVFVPRS